MLVDLLITKLGLGDDVVSKLAAEYDCVNDMVALVESAEELARDVKIPLETAESIMRLACQEVKWASRKLKLNSDDNEKARMSASIAGEERRNKSSEATKRPL